MIEGTVEGVPRILILATVRGLLSDVGPLLARLDGFGPGAVGLGLSAEEARGLREYFVARTSEPLVPLSPNEVAEVRALARYGEVRVPNPTYPAVLEWGLDRGTPVEAIDPSEDRYAQMFTDHIGYTELVRRTLRERKLTRSPPDVPTADEFALAWAGSLSGDGGSARLARARDAVLAEGARTLGSRHALVAVVVERERFDGVRAALGEAVVGR